MPIGARRDADAGVVLGRHSVADRPSVPWLSGAVPPARGSDCRHALWMTTGWYDFVEEHHSLKGRSVDDDLDGVVFEVIAVAGAVVGAVLGGYLGVEQAPTDTAVFVAAAVVGLSLAVLSDALFIERAHRRGPIAVVMSAILRVLGTVACLLILAGLFGGLILPLSMLDRVPLLREWHERFPAGAEYVVERVVVLIGFAAVAGVLWLLDRLQLLFIAIVGLGVVAWPGVLGAVLSPWIAMPLFGLGGAAAFALDGWPGGATGAVIGVALGATGGTLLGLAGAFARVLPWT